MVAELNGSMASVLFASGFGGEQEPGNLRNSGNIR
jgi:hypothetical protein